MLHTDLEKRREFYIRQLIRLAGEKRENLVHLNTNELQLRERNFYHDKYNSHGKSEYEPSTL